jgi:selenocysteine lyase/cysteine desulfurase
MKAFANEFGPFDEVAWINASHQGALPRVAVDAVNEAVEWKRFPHFLSDSQLFVDVPRLQREAIGQLVNCPADEIILGNSASYGLHLLANGIRWRPGDEVLVVRGDFPANILPWLGLEPRGVKIVPVALDNGRLSLDALENSINPRTRLLSVSWVFSFWGTRLDLRPIRELCNQHGIKLVLNCSQGIGAMPFDIDEGLADAVTCVGFKWLCGPYGTGFCWVDPEFRDELEYNQAYWLSMQSVSDLSGEQDIPVLRDDLGARKYDVFGTASFFNLKPWTESVNLLSRMGIDGIWAYNQTLVQRLIDGLDPNSYEIISPVDRGERSNILVVSHRDERLNQPIFEALTQQSVYISLRAGRLRFSPHVFNTEDHIDRALNVLRDFGKSIV